MAWAFDGYCYGTEAELVAAVTSVLSPDLFAIPSNDPAYGLYGWSVGVLGADDGVVRFNFLGLQISTNTWVGTPADQTSVTYPTCSDEGPLNSDPYILTAEQLPLYSGALALMFFTAYAGKKLRTFIEGYSR